MRTTLNLAGLLAAAVSAVSAACVLPGTPPSSTILEPFQIQIQNASYPVIHNKHMNLLPAGGGDRHLFTEPVGVPTFDLTLVNGVITKDFGAEGIIRAVVGGEHSDIDNTDKIFTTGRGDPRAVYQPSWACNPETDQPQIELTFLGQRRDGGALVPGGWTCVRPTYDNAYEFRFYPPGNLANDPNKFCIKVTLVALVSQGGGSTGTSSTTQTTTTAATTTVTSTSSATTFTTLTTSSSSSSSSSSTSASSTASSTAVARFTDMTARGYSFQGCAPEERTANDGTIGRTLNRASFADDAMTNERCLDFCRAQGYTLAGTEYRRECWCANALFSPGRTPATTIASLDGCQFPCAGAPTQQCGGAAWLSLYKQCDPGQPCVNAVFT